MSPLKLLVLLGLLGIMVRLTWYGWQFPYPVDRSLIPWTADIVVCSGFMSQISVHHVKVLVYVLLGKILPIVSEKII